MDASDATPKKNTLEVDTGLSVASGKTLDLQSGIDLEVYPGKTLRVDGTLTADALRNNGTTIVTSGNTLQLRGGLTNAGTLNVTATGRVVADGTFTNTGTVTLAAGATVMAKTFAAGAAPSGWEVSASADANGYYKLVPEPEPFSVTFDANGGKWDADTGQTIVQVEADGTVALPEAPQYGEAPTDADPNIGLKFMGWFDAPVDGTEYTASSVFSEDTTLYAQWDGWYLDAAGTLVIGGQGSLGKYFEFSGGSSDQYSVPKWQKDYFPTIDSSDNRGNPNIKNVLILEGVTNIDSFWTGPGAFTRCDNLEGITIPSTVTFISAAFFECGSLTRVTFQPGSTLETIMSSAFSSCTGLKHIALPDSVTRIDGSAFLNCSALENVTIPANVLYIGDNAFEGCASNLVVQYGGTVAQWRTIFRADSKFPAGAKLICSDGSAYTIDGEAGEGPPPVEP